ncbi:dockerin type I domain-containing protein [Paenibacillus daejeonensis]|uniref:dockerin type I domain-containing protein n=1 Tax=Paenibacillus daejeonensis TaxID=135193 RepID=UPI0003782738|nr:dockerin type I domain-containing protein [Paenibacillus daejeonensis]
MKRTWHQGVLTFGLSALVAVAPWQQLPVAFGQQQEDAGPESQVTGEEGTVEDVQARENNEAEGSLPTDAAEEQASEADEEGLAEDDAVQVLAEEVDYDLNGDGVLSVGDLAIVAAAYGLDADDEAWEQHAQADLNRDGKVDVVDLTLMASAIMDGSVDGDGVRTLLATDDGL